ncbi:hypothetical protein HDU83_000455 [Entophlyctis luteolus]|nr:hypothetical protein HDU83_000455 [Entophlyctis luteolus]
MAAMLATDSLVLVQCNVCAKTVLQSSLLQHLENCRRLNPTAPLFADEPPPLQPAQSAAAVASVDAKKAAVKRKRDEATATAASKSRDKKKDPMAAGVSSPAPPAPAAASATPVPIDSVKEKEKDKSRSKAATRGPVDLDKQCGVLLESGPVLSFFARILTIFPVDVGLPCSRSITCKIHSVFAKRSVAGRTQHYDSLIAEYQMNRFNSASSGAAPLALGSSGIAGNSRKLPAGSLAAGPSTISHVPSESEAAELFAIIKSNAPPPIMRPVALSLAELLKKIETRNVACTLREIRDKRLAASAPNSGVASAAAAASAGGSRGVVIKTDLF